MLRRPKMDSSLTRREAEAYSIYCSCLKIDSEGTTVMLVEGTSTAPAARRELAELGYLKIICPLGVSAFVVSSN